MDGQWQRFRLTLGFWSTCTEIRDADGMLIRDWLARHHTLDWEMGKPPRFELVPLGRGRFRLVP